MKDVFSHGESRPDSKPPRKKWKFDTKNRSDLVVEEFFKSACSFCGDQA